VARHAAGKKKKEYCMHNLSATSGATMPVYWEGNVEYRTTSFMLPYGLLATFIAS